MVQVPGRGVGKTVKALEVRSLSFSYRAGGERALEGVEFTLERGQVLGLTGPSGGGKSTLCLALSGIIPHSGQGRMEGQVLIMGRDTREMTLPQIATRCGIVFQDPETQLFLPRIRNEVAFGPENLCLPRDRIRRIVEETAREAGIEHLLDRNPNQLSGGEQQIVALASVLALDPEIMVLDEVSSQLDEAGAARIQGLLARLKDQGRTLVMVDHDPSRLALADTVLVLEEGRPAGWGPRETVLADYAGSGGPAGGRGEGP